MNGGRNIFNAIPPVTKNLIIINFIIWLAMMIVPSRTGFDITKFGALHYFEASDFNPVQLVTYMFMHSTRDFAHILFNMFTLFMFGITLERVIGSQRFLFYYLSCGIGAALIQELVWSFTWQDAAVKTLANLYHVDFPEMRDVIQQVLSGKPIGNVRENLMAFQNMYVTVGASGAIYGVLLAFGMLFPNRPLYLMFVPVPIKAKWMVIGYGAIELLIGLSQANDGVAHFAHLGGMIFGFIMIYYWKKKGIVHGDSF